MSDNTPMTCRNCGEEIELIDGICWEHVDLGMVRCVASTFAEPEPQGNDQ
jgi:predicted amidophosphoribosyltransferase